MKEEEKKWVLFRDLYNKGNSQRLAQRIKKVYPEFHEKGFINKIHSKIDDLNFGDRSKLIQDSIIEYLPNNFEEVCRILVESLNPKLEREEDFDYEDFIVIPETYVIERLGMDNFELSMETLKEMTMRCSSEGAIRRFIENYTKESLSLLMKWTKDENLHVRRLVSEGTRPRLPLESPIKMFVKDPSPIIPLLEELKDDEALYVRRSVANNLNDISKDNPQIVIDTLNKWKIDASKERLWVINHSLRTLFKQGNTNALAILGYETPKIEVNNFTIQTPKVKLGESLEFEFNIKSNKKQKLMIDYVIHFVKANGKTAPKTFKISKKEVKKGEEIKISKKHPLKKMTTRELYSGTHYIELQINGVKFEKKVFEFSN